jgi:hypothetical protein
LTEWLHPDAGPCVLDRASREIFTVFEGNRHP